MRKHMYILQVGVKSSTIFTSYLVYLKCEMGFTSLLIYATIVDVGSQYTVKCTLNEVVYICKWQKVLFSTEVHKGVDIYHI